MVDGAQHQSKDQSSEIDLIFVITSTSRLGLLAELK